MWNEKPEPAPQKGLVGFGRARWPGRKKSKPRKQNHRRLAAFLPLTSWRGGGGGLLPAPSSLVDCGPLSYCSAFREVNSPEAQLCVIFCVCVCAFMHPRNWALFSFFFFNLFLFFLIELVPQIAACLAGFPSRVCDHHELFPTPSFSSLVKNNIPTIQPPNTASSYDRRNVLTLGKELTSSVMWNVLFRKHA